MSTGYVMFVPMTNFKVYCNLNYLDWPFDEQVCELILRTSGTYKTPLQFNDTYVSIRVAYIFSNLSPNKSGLNLILYVYTASGRIHYVELGNSQPDTATHRHQFLSSLPWPDIRDALRISSEKNRKGLLWFRVAPCLWYVRRNSTNKNTPETSNQYFTCSRHMFIIIGYLLATPNLVEEISADNHLDNYVFGVFNIFFAPGSRLQSSVTENKYVLIIPSGQSGRKKYYIVASNALQINDTNMLIITPPVLNNLLAISGKLTLRRYNI